MWIWQQENWPHFYYEKEALSTFEEQYSHHFGILKGSFIHLDESEKKLFIVEMMSEEALKTSEIEGDYLNRASVQSSIKRHFGLETSYKSLDIKEQGISDN